MEKIKYHILVVDDDDRIRELVKEYLKEKKFIVSTANSAEEAKIKMGYFRFDLIVLDVMMPGQNGFELTQEIKKNSNIPIILLTAKGEVENRIEGLELGADDYLGKPFEPKELLLRIKNRMIKQLKDKNDTRRKNLYLDREGTIFFDKLYDSQKKRIVNALKSSEPDTVIKFKEVLKKIINGK